MSDLGHCVVDASVAVKLFLTEEEFSEHAQELFAALQEDPRPRFLVPDLFYLECVHTLVRKLRGKHHKEDLAWDHTATLFGYNLEVVASLDLVRPALALVRRYGIGTYDAVYVALASQEDVPMITADEKLLRRLKGSPWVVELGSHVEAQRRSLPISPEDEE
jgi:predicted nucleic acid-binding protein